MSKLKNFIRHLPVYAFRIEEENTLCLLFPIHSIASTLFKNLKKTQILGLSLIVLSWIFWGMILVVPFLELGFRSSSIIITILLIGSNIFWFGAILAGKELLPKIKFWIKNNIRLDKDNSI